MAGAQAIGYNDPYFLQAYNSPNSLQMQQMQQAQVQQAQQTSSTNPFAAQNSIMQNITPKATEEPKKKNNTVAWAVLGTAALVGTGWMIYRGKKAGAEGLGKQIIAGLKSFGNKSANAKNVATGGIQNGKKFCTIPGKTNVMRKAGEISGELANIGAKGSESLSLADITRTLDDGTQALAEGFSVRRGTFKVGENLVTIKNGKVIKYVDKNGKDILSRYLEPDAVSIYAKKNGKAKKAIDDMIASISKGQKLDQVNNLEIVHKADGVVQKFVRQNPADDFAREFALSNRFDLNSDVVKNYRLSNSTFHENLLKFEKGESVGNILSAEYKSPIGTLLIENDSVVGIRDAAGKIYKNGSNRFGALKYDNYKIFENALKENAKYTNVVRVIG